MSKLLTSYLQILWFLVFSGCDSTPCIDVTSHVAKTPIEEPCSTVTKLQEGQHQKIVCYGTSLTARGAWVRQIQLQLDAEYPGLADVVNSGKGAMWSKWGVENLDERVIDLNPDAVLIEFSINDAYLEYKTSVTQAKQNLETIVSSIQKSDDDTEIILMIMNPPLGIHLERRPEILKYESMYRDVASSRGLRLIDCSNTWRSLLNADPDAWCQLVPDNIHPNALGCSLVVTPCVLRGLGVAPIKHDDITRIGKEGGLAVEPLPHHPVFGSASGGSDFSQ